MLPLSSEDRRALLGIARDAIRKAVVHQPAATFDSVSGALSSPPSGRLAEPHGAFVTLHLRHRLRGCIGRAETSDSLAETVAHSAVSAALHDPRFAPVSGNEVSELQIEVSVLSPLFPISAEAIEAGAHGVLVRRGNKGALLLPQVAAERHWSSSRFLAETCRKAGLDPEAWRDPQTQLFGFTVEAFSESALPADYSSST
jgi:AmmeMemoRadiSam system protein A